MNDYSDLNISTLSGEYREKGPALQAYKRLSRFIEKENNQHLKTLLRHHNEGTVYADELYQRFEVDDLLEYYSLLQVAIFAGYISPQLHADLKTEIICLLDNPSVKKYYEVNYPCFLPSLLRYSLKRNISYTPEHPELSQKLFNEFMLANRSLENEEDVEYFLKFLDYVSIGNYDLSDLIELLRDSERLSHAFNKPQKENPVERSLWGFIKYTDFLTRLKEVLIKADPAPLLQSAMWEYHSYWFRIMSNEMKKFFHQAFDNLNKAIAQVPREDIVMKMNEEEEEEFSFMAQQQHMIHVVSAARETLEYVLRDDFVNPVRNYHTSTVIRHGTEDPIQALPQFKTKHRKRNGEEGTGSLDNEGQE